MGCAASNALNVPKPEIPEAPCTEVDFATDFFEQYCLGAKLGQGSFAQVREVRLLTSLPSGAATFDDDVRRSDKCAKVLDLRDTRGKECPILKELAAMEVSISQRVRHHPNVVKVFGSYKQAGIAFVLMEKCSCSLAEYMRDLPKLNEKSIGKLVFQMMTSLHHLHSLRVVHRDVKPDNFLMGGPSGHTVKLCDFGLAAVLPENGTLCGPVGTTPFMCPEMCGGFSYNESADIWSIAVMVYVFLFGGFPYTSKDGTKEGMMRAIVKGSAPTFEPADKRKQKPSPNACKFVSSLLQRCGDHRPSAGEALNAPYMVQVMTGRHMKNLPLPSLGSEFNSAYKIGAISSGSVAKKTDMDDLLSIMQYKRLGVKMPQAWKSSQPQPQRAKRACEKVVTSFVEIGIESFPLSKISEASPRSTSCGSPWGSPSLSPHRRAHMADEGSWDSPPSMTPAMELFQLDETSPWPELEVTPTLSKCSTTCSSRSNKSASSISL